jgi:uncharacterized protein
MKEFKMSSSTSAVSTSQSVKPAPWWEVILIMLVYLGIGVIMPALKQIITIPLILYMLLESWLRHRSWSENGFSFRDIAAGFRQTFGWFLLVVIGTQALSTFGVYFLLPAVSDHILARIPYDVSSLSVGLFIFLGIATFLEELIFRALFQNRLSASFSPSVSILIVSLFFALAHFEKGPALIVFVDLFSEFVDSLIFGVIFQRSKNVFVSWIPHFFADIVGLFMILALK